MQNYCFLFIVQSILLSSSFTFKFLTIVQSEETENTKQIMMKTVICRNFWIEKENHLKPWGNNFHASQKSNYCFATANITLKIKKLLDNYMLQNISTCTPQTWYLNIYGYTWRSLFMGICFLRSKMISEREVNWLFVREYGSALRRLLVSGAHSLIVTSLILWFLYMINNSSLSDFVPIASSIWNSLPN